MNQPQKTLVRLQDVFRDRRPLTEEETKAAIEALMSGEVPDEEVISFLTAWNEKGVHPDEVLAAARTLRAHAVPFAHQKQRLMDTCGTGGDAKHTINASTLTAFIVAACGVPVVKHGNRAVSSVCGSACLLEALGAVIDLDPGASLVCLDEVNMAFLFAPRYHPAMKHVAAARRAMGVKTIFNLLGPLVHPGGVTHQLVGVYDAAWVEPFARILKDLGVISGVVVCGEGGLDEVSLSGPTHYARFTQVSFESGRCKPEDFGLESVPLSRLQISNKETAVEAARDVLSGRPGSHLDFVRFNAAFALWAAEEVESIEEGLKRAQTVLREGHAADLMRRFVETTQRLGRKPQS